MHAEQEIQRESEAGELESERGKEEKSKRAKRQNGAWGREREIKQWRVSVHISHWHCTL